jgi:hypothetical protein
MIIWDQVTNFSKWLFHRNATVVRMPRQSPRFLLSSVHTLHNPFFMTHHDLMRWALGRRNWRSEIEAVRVQAAEGANCHKGRALWKGHMTGTWEQPFRAEGGSPTAARKRRPQCCLSKDRHPAYRQWPWASGKMVIPSDTLISAWWYPKQRTYLYSWTSDLFRFWLNKCFKLLNLC